MSTTSEQHAEYLDAEQAEGDRLEERAQSWPDGLPLEPPLTPEDEERLAALMTTFQRCGAPVHYRDGEPMGPCALPDDHEELCKP